MNWNTIIVASFYRCLKNEYQSCILHIGDQLPSVPVAYIMIVRETYKNLKNLLNSIQYNKHQWMICADLKVVPALTGLQVGCIKLWCFLYLWDSRGKHSHSKRKYGLSEMKFIQEHKTTQFYKNLKGETHQLLYLHSLII